MQKLKDSTHRGPASSTRTLLLLSLACLIIGTAGYFALPRDVWAFYLSAHLGALGVLGLFGVAAGALAKRRGRPFWPAFYLGSVLPAAAGLVAVFAYFLRADGHLYCGGSVCLLVAIVVVLAYSLVRRNAPAQTGLTR